MNIASDSSQSCGGSGLLMVFNLLLEFIGVFSGYGFMASSIRNQDKPTGGSCPKSISSCLIECWQILPSILEWANTSVSFWQLTKPVGIPVRWWKPQKAFI